ncbi:hypothetical protein [Flavobacterium aestivum]|jgi:predicted transcriptional regulator|uniref:hypothetical protein n=1 Tax=Flavobacterium aestivum TaxID=3003257 RepID=UPI002286A382|nr:hypothetical protein [Flavobacterium aestivum]
MAGINNSTQIKVTGTNPFETKSKANALSQLSKLDVEVLTKLVELSKSPMAITHIKNNFPMIKGFLSA